MARVSLNNPPIRHFLYPLNPKSKGGYILIDDDEVEHPTSYQGFMKTFNLDRPSEWRLANGYRKTRANDMVWVYFTKPDGAIRAVGRVSESPHWNHDWDCWAILISWDRALIDRLAKQPIPYERFQQRVQGAVVEANEPTARVLKSWLKSNQSETSRRKDAAVGFVTREVESRLGQAEFRSALMKAYGGRCAITGCEVSDALQAAHLRGVRDGGDHSVSNGLLLRADIHNLFDRGWIWIDDDLTVHVDDDLPSNSDYSKFHGRVITPPRTAGSGPSKAALRRHRSIHRR